MDIIGIALLVIIAVVVVVLIVGAIVHYGWLREPHLDSFSVGPRVWCPKGSCPLAGGLYVDKCSLDRDGQVRHCPR